MDKIWEYIYQYIALIAIIGLLFLSFIKTGQFNEILLGALVGVVSQISINKTSTK